VESSAAEVDIVQHGPTQIRANQRGAAHPGLEHLGASQVGRPQNGLGQVSVVQDSPSKVRSRKLACPQTREAQVRAAERGEFQMLTR
jgi:hypothetical protein